MKSKAAAADKNPSLTEGQAPNTPGVKSHRGAEEAYETPWKIPLHAPMY